MRPCVNFLDVHKLQKLVRIPVNRTKTQKIPNTQIGCLSNIFLFVFLLLLLFGWKGIQSNKQIGILNSSLIKTSKPSKRSKHDCYTFTIYSTISFTEQLLNLKKLNTC